MSLPLVRAVPRFSTRLAGAAVLMLAGWAATAPSGLAAGPDLFSATVTVDATADSVVKARDRARLDGQRRALTAVVDHLAGGTAELPKLDDTAITNLVTSFSVAKERMSAVRYLASYTFHFRPAAIKRLMSNAGIAMAPASGGNGEAGHDGSGKAAASPQPPTTDRQAAAPGGKSGGKDEAAGKDAAVSQPAGQTQTVLIPVFRSGGQMRLWEEPNPWRQAWERQAAAAGSAQLVVPLGDAGDLAAIDAGKAGAGNAQAIATVASHNEAGQAVVAMATLQGPPDKPSGLDVALRRYRAGQLVDSETSRLAAKPGESTGDLLHRAVAASVAELASSETWKREPVAGDGGHGQQPQPAGAQPPGPQMGSLQQPPGLRPVNLQPGNPPTGINEPPPGESAQTGSLTAVLSISGLDDWVHARERIASLPAVRQISLMALSQEDATIEISYVGSIDDLKSNLAKISLDLVHGDRSWRLARTAPAGKPAASP